MPSAPAALAYIVMNLSIFFIFAKELQNGVFIAAAIGIRELDTIFYFMVLGTEYGHIGLCVFIHFSLY